MSESIPTPATESVLGLLLRVKVRSMWNRLRQAADEAPVRLSATVILLGVVWLGLYLMFHLVFRQLKRSPLEATVAIPLVFNFFFVAMLVLLTFSNAIIAYGAMFGKRESAYLLSSPLLPRDVVSLKFIETLVAASWALVVLGFPLMISMAELAGHRLFYVLFISFFIAFLPIPCAIGIFLAWSAARFFPRRALRLATVVVGVSVGGFIIWGVRSMRMAEGATENWLRAFYAKMSFVESAFLPNTWVAQGIDHALQDQFSESLLYLGVTIANALFLSWLAVVWVSRYFESALDRASAARGTGRRPASAASGGLAGRVFFYLPRPLRLVAAKDLRTFFRDPMQWSQLVILFGLLALYLTNMPTLRMQLAGWGWAQVVPFLNVCAISLVLATFTCRFVFPLVSIEGKKLWLIGLLPVPRGQVLFAKFAFAMTVTLVVAVCAMARAATLLNLNQVWTAIHLATIVGICFGLCGFAVGIGARLPMFDEVNPARIANGLGGTLNLLASVALVMLILAGLGLATWQSRKLTYTDWPSAGSIALCVASAMTGVIAGLVALATGIRHFNRMEV